MIDIFVVFKVQGHCYLQFKYIFLFHYLSDYKELICVFVILIEMKF